MHMDPGVTAKVGTPDVRRGARPRDDRIDPVTRWIALLLVPILVTAFIILYFFPDNTQQLFAWTIKPTMTPMLMGGGYVAGGYFFARVFLEQRWHLVTRGFLPVTTFASFMGVATILHWDRFNHAHVSFYAWLLLYAVTPFLVPLLWLRNRRRDPGTPDRDDVIVPMVLRWVLGLVGLVNLACGLLLFALPGVMIAIWPWTLTPLTARVIGGWFALPGVVGPSVAIDPRWSAWRIILQSQLLGIALILIGAARAWADFDPTNPLRWGFVAGMAGLLVLLAALYVAMEGRRPKGEPLP